MAGKLIGFCGIDCEKCDAYIATQTDDQALREKTARLWAALNNAPILPQHICCDGCRGDGRKTVFCEGICAVRKCAMAKGFESCGNCLDGSGCEALAAIHANSPQARENLGMGGRE